MGEGKMGWIYPTHYTDGTLIPEALGSGGINPDYGKAVPCACSQAKQEQRYGAFLREQANLPVPPRGRLAWTFSDYETPTADHLIAMETVRNWAAGTSPYRWVFLAGNPGTGKTHLCAAAVAALVGAGMYARYEYIPDLVDYLRLHQIDGGYEDRIAQLRAVEALVLDDLNAAQSAETAWARGEILKLIDWRYREQAPLIVTTNGDTDQIEPRTLDRLMDRHLSRFEMMVWQSYRTSVSPH